MLPRYFPGKAKRETAFAIPFASPVIPLLTRLLDYKARGAPELYEGLRPMLSISL